MRSHRPLLPLAILALGLLLSATGCTTLRALLGDVTKPEFTFKRVNLQGLSFESVTLGLVYEVTNPYEIPIELAEVNYKLAVEGKQVFSGSPNRGVRVPAGRSREITFPAEFRFADLGSAARAIFTKDQLGWKASGTVGLDTPVGILRFPLSKSGTLDRPDLPRVRIAAVRAPRITATGAELRVALDVTNTNPFPMPLEAIRYGLRVAGTEVGSGTVRSAAVAAGATRRIELPLLGLSQAGQGLQQLLAGRSTDVRVTGSFDFGSLSGPLDVARQVVLSR